MLNRFSLLLRWRDGKRLLIFLIMELFNCKLRLIISAESFLGVVFYEMCGAFRR